MDDAGRRRGGTGWSSEENDILVTDYFAMLGEELAGRSYNKAEHRRAVVAQLGRSEPSIEFKHRNVSAVLTRLGLPRIKGYLPAWNAQFGGLAAAIDRTLFAKPGLLSPTIRPPAAAKYDLFVEPPSLSDGSDRRQEPIQRLILKFDPAERDARNRALGRQGEAFVLEAEQRRLHAAGKVDLMRQVRWVADLDGDGAGYDIQSFDPETCAPKLIEVKTTCGDARTPFFITRNEEALSRERPDAFRLYRLFDFAAAPRAFEIAPPLDGSLRLETANWTASFG